MVTKGTPERMLSDEERVLLEYLKRPAPESYDTMLDAIIQKHAGKWTWEHGALKAPTMYHTKREATDAFERYVTLLTDFQRAESNSRYQVNPSDG